MLKIRFRVFSFGLSNSSFNTVTRLRATKIRSSAWLEHYTDNVGVTSSNLVGSTIIIYLAGSPPSLKLMADEGGLAQLA